MKNYDYLSLVMGICSLISLVIGVWGLTQVKKGQKEEIQNCTYCILVSFTPIPFVLIILFAVFGIGWCLIDGLPLLINHFLKEEN